MHIEEIGEFELIRRIDRIVSRIPSPKNRLIGIGDDAAVVVPRGQCVLTTDALVEGVHFDRSYADLISVGWKSLAVNLSDIAAMGAEPRWALVALNLPVKMTVRDVELLYRGIADCALKYGIGIVGGNITRSRELSITITAVGEVSKYLKRSGSKNRDVIAVTGDLGAAKAGLRILNSGTSKAGYSYVCKRHLRPEPRTDWIRTLKRKGVAIHACIDISDGLSSDLKHLCEAGRHGAEIDLNCIPIHAETKKAARRFNQNVMNYAMAGGEDYELLMTMPPKEFLKAKKILKHNIHAIGTVIPGKALLALDIDGRLNAIGPAGFTHF